MGKKIKIVPLTIGTGDDSKGYTEFCSEKFKVAKGQRVIIIGVDHHKDIQASLSVIEIYSDETNVKSLITGDRHNYYPANHHPEVEIIEFHDVGYFYVKECIYPEFRDGHMIPHSSIISARIYVV